MNRILTVALAGSLSSIQLFGMARGGAGLLAEYDSNVFGDYWGGGSPNATAYLDLALDHDLGHGGLAVGADYYGDVKAYLHYQDDDQSDHEFRLLIWRNAGRDGFVGAGAGLEYSLNGPERGYFDSRYLYGTAEGKFYLLPPLLARFSAAYGNQDHPHLQEYDCRRASGELSATVFLPSRTSVSLVGNARWYGYTPGPDSQKVPESILHLDPGIRLTQSLTARLGLSVEYSGTINRVSTAGQVYQPDTLLFQVHDYSDYRGGTAGTKLTAMLRKATVAVRAGYQFRDYTTLFAFELPRSDTFSMAARLATTALRRDRIETLGVEAGFPLSPNIRTRIGLEFLDHGSNDALFDYHRTITSAGLEYRF